MRSFSLLLAVTALAACATTPTDGSGPSAAAAAIDAASGAPDTPDARMVAARAYVQSEGVQSMMDDMFAPEAMVTQIRASLPPEVSLTEAQVNELAQIASEEVHAIRPEIEAAMVDASAEVFTLSELQAMTAFYESEVGAAIMPKTAVFMQQYTTQMGPAMREMAGNIQRRVGEVLQSAAE